MDIAEFYDTDERRRRSEELSFGLDWRDAEDPQHLLDLYWVRDTGELYFMAKPARHWPSIVNPADAESLGAGIQEIEEGLSNLTHNLFHPGHRETKAGSAAGPHQSEEASSKDLRVEIVGVVPGEDELRLVLSGWRDRLGKPDGAAWVRSAVAQKAGQDGGSQ